MKPIIRILIWLTIFSIAMAFLESAVVVYLRALYYPHGFCFPLQPIDKTIGITEIFRELATLIMLLCAGYFSGKTFSEKFAGFIYSFAVWDIFYYVFLKLILNWPESFYTWDILFLLPVEWVGPVLSPVIVSFTMILLAFIILKFSVNNKVKILLLDWLLLISGSVIIIVSFTLDYCSFIYENFSFSGLKSVTFSDDLFKLSLQYVPEKFNWIIFWIGEIVIFTSIFLFYKRQLKLKDE